MEEQELPPMSNKDVCTSYIRPLDVIVNKVREILPNISCSYAHFIAKGVVARYIIKKLSDDESFNYACKINRPVIAMN